MSVPKDKILIEEHMILELAKRVVNQAFENYPAPKQEETQEFDFETNEPEHLNS
jgi:hypothetical protein